MMISSLARLPEHLDIAIVGGGPVGAALALALCDSGLVVAVLEARSEPVGADPRGLALSYGSIDALDKLGVWRQIGDGTAIETVHVSQRDGFGHATLSCDELRLPALGYVVNYSSLARACEQALQDGPCHYVTGVALDEIKLLSGYAALRVRQGGEVRLLTAGLVVVADGGKGLTQLPGIERREHDYGQHAIVCNVRSDKPHRGVAYERFDVDGPMALLPHGDGFALVWTRDSAVAPEWLALTDEVFIERLQQAFGDRAGRFVGAGPRVAFPLALKRLVQPVTTRTALIGNAAQVLHPVAGQGFNLGLRDALDLALEIKACPRGEIGNSDMLQRYQRRRARDVTATTAFTDSLIKLFGLHGSLLSTARGTGLAALDLLPAARRRFTQHMVFGSGK